jgi:hypothetical protein
VNVVEAIKEVAGFANDDATFGSFANVCFHKGEVWAMGPAAGAVEPTPDLDISIAVPARKMTRAIQAMGKKDVEFSVEGSRLTIRGAGKATVEGALIKDQPKVHKPPAEGWIQVAGMARLPQLEDTVSKDTTRRHLSGVHFQDDRAESTDGHGMMRLQLQVDKPLPSAIVMVAALSGLPDVCWLAHQGGRLFISAVDPTKGNSGLGYSGLGYRFAGIVEAAFPPAQEIINGAKEQPVMTVDRLALIDLVKRARLSNKMIRIEVVRNKLTVAVDEGGDTLFAFASSVEFETKVKGNAVPSGVIGFDSTLLLPMLSHATSAAVDLWLTPDPKGGLGPLMLIDGPFTAVLMPCRL